MPIPSNKLINKEGNHVSPGGHHIQPLVALFWAGGRCNIYVRWSKDFELVNSIGVNTIFILVQVEKLYKAILSKLSLVLRERRTCVMPRS